MEKLYKLTEQDGTTHNGYFYGEVGKVHKKPVKENPQLCSSDVFHGYKNKNLAFLLNPIHVNISNPVLWEIEGDVVCSDFGKVGSFEQKVVEKLEYPAWVGSDREKSVRVMFAILCAESVLHIYENKYPGDKRVRNVINAAKECLKNPAAATYDNAVASTVYDAAYDAASDAYDAASDTFDAYDAYAAASAASAAASAAYAAYDASTDAIYAAAASDAYDAYAAASVATYAAYASDAYLDFAKLADMAVDIIFKIN